MKASDAQRAIDAVWRIESVRLIAGLHDQNRARWDRAYGFHSFAALAAMVFLCCTDPQLTLPI